MDGDGSCFITSYNWCTRSQTIDLLAAGFSEAFLDRSPPLLATESFKGHQNTADFYFLRVELRDENGAVLDSWEAGTQAAALVADGTWRTESHTFENYPAGVRQIYWEDGGDDAEFWAGHYGTLLDGAELSFIDPAPTGIDVTPGTYPVGAVAGGAAGVLTSEDTAGSVHTYELVAETAPQTLVPFGSVWSFLDDGSDQGTAWRTAAFDDSTWPTGGAELGYGEGDEVTVLGGQNNHFTNYFRHHFTMTAAGVAEAESLTLRLKRDDGVAVYLNGTEVALDNLVSNALFDTPAIGNASDDGQAIHTFTVPPNLLVEGDNVLAAEIHQTNLTSSDASFDLELEAEVVDDEYDNALFVIDGDRLEFAQDAATVPVTIGGSWFVNVRTTDDAGNTLTQVLTISGVADPTQPPTAIALSPDFVTEGQLAGTVVGDLIATDADPGDLHSFSLVAGAGDTDNGLFQIASGRLVTATVLDAIAQPTATVRVRAEDRVGLAFEQSLTIEIQDQNDVPTEIQFDGMTVTVGEPAGTLIGTLSTDDPDPADVHTYSFIPVAGSDPVFGFGSEWRFLDDGSNLDGVDWTDIADGFDDSAWKVGVGSFGYGDAQVTAVDSGPDDANKYVTTYFRRTFELPDPSAYEAFELQIMRDDGVAVYLNSEPVARDGLADDAGALDFATQTIGAPDETTPISFAVPSAMFSAGTNTLSAEVHQATASSSDLTFDLALGGTIDISGSDRFEIVNGNEVRTNAPFGGFAPGTVLNLMVRSDDGRGGAIEETFPITVLSDDPDDQDGDGLPDVWELEHFPSLAGQSGADDSDGDGQTNAEEYIFDTVPTDAASRQGLTISRFGATGYSLRWPTSAARSYQLQSSDTLDGGTWIDVGGARVGNGAPMAQLVNRTGIATRHYRVRVLLP